jgi:signal transduction histidine kinase
MLLFRERYNLPCRILYSGKTCFPATGSVPAGIQRGLQTVSENNAVPGTNDGSTGSAGSGSREAELNRKLRRMSSIARHDINNQLTILNGYLSLLESGMMKSGDAVPILQSATGKIERILRFTREYQELGVKYPAWQNVDKAVCSARAIVDPGTVRLRQDGCTCWEIYADPLLERAFAGLIDNSLRHGGHVTEIQVRCTEAQSGLVILYEDNGAGIPPAVRSSLFEHAKGKNTGYGLFVVKEILSMTGLSIAETGEPGKGVRFEIMVPEGSFRATER